MRLLSHAAFAVVRVLQRRRPDVVYFVETRGTKLVALTIDDGPHPETTPAILDLLSRHEVHATFFLIGARATAEPELVERIASAGHEVANHGWEDERASALDPADLERSMDRTDRSLRTTERPVELYRPGGGRVNDAVTSACRGRYRCVLASVYPFDVYVPLDHWITWLVRATVRPGAVIILHEGTARRMRVVSILDAVLRDLDARGYEVTTVSSLLARRG